MSFNSVCNHTRDKQIGLSLRGRAIFLSLVWLQTELDSTQSYYHYLSIFYYTITPNRLAPKQFSHDLQLIFGVNSVTVIWGSFQIDIPRSTFHVPRFTFHVPNFTSHVPRSAFLVSRSTFHVPCCMLHASCSMFHVYGFIDARKRGRWPEPV